ncbi:hypothetical protein BO79DRAFT_239554 [Aspergillus costaricaensis CBS 115574]|uniref:Uncharacterized protein n=1 Tax=Aspergillus costaricaensis CBS 115574 TaxID=1448317 RepID=A0ACD1I6V1_9EURO|nr:hypothetical protein BO79DRAFT_239554 [Aspergillus costaricaensis CBS 115574]RAK86001.1 hypothetical protein BO79DRAFT_239554 [Aspergillus costaricaensis CBS 115574]
MKDEVKTSSSIQQMANHLQSNSARGARVQRVDPPFWPRLGRFRFGCPGEGRGGQSKEERGQAGSMELWIAAYGSRKRVTVAKTVLVSPWLVLELWVARVVMGKMKYENRLSGWAVWLQLNSKWINPSDPDR